MTKKLTSEDVRNILIAQLPELSENDIDTLDEQITEDGEGYVTSYNSYLCEEDIVELAKAIKASGLEIVLLMLSGNDSRGTDYDITEVAERCQKHWYEIVPVTECNYAGLHYIDLDTYGELAEHGITEEIIKHLEKDFDHNDGCSTYFWGNGYILVV